MARAARKIEHPRLGLRFPPEDVLYWAARFPGPEGDRRLDAVRARTRKQGHLTRPDFLALCAWKSPRSRPRCLENSERDVRAITRAAFASADEEVKVELLRLLRGVAWATASTLLHVCDTRPYPILDVRALWSVGHARTPHVTLPDWLDYVDFTRAVARECGVSMRTLDRALWQYSKERQRHGAPSPPKPRQTRLF